MEYSNHAIICGFGTVGMYATNVLLKAMNCVVIEKNRDVSHYLQELEIPHLIADATQEKTLKKAGVERASVLVAALGDDAENVGIIVAARHLNKRLVIASRTHRQETIANMRKAGADIVVMPEVVGGSLLAKETLKNLMFKV